MAHRTLLGSSTTRGLLLAALALAGMLFAVTPAFAGPTDLVTFDSPALEQAVCDMWGFTPGAVTEADMAWIPFLDVQNAGITSLEGLQYATSLEFLGIDRNFVEDLSPISGLTQLTYLQFEHNRVVSLAPVAGLVNLNYLDGNFNDIESIAPVAALTNLNELYLQENRVSDVSALAGLTNLTGVAFGNDVQDITSLNGLTNLTFVYISRNYLDTTPGSAAMNTIDLLNSRHPNSVQYLPQKALPVAVPASSTWSLMLGAVAALAISGVSIRTRRRAVCAAS